jgi:predicted unusual protein kinase regulating ubiquinone biosynthesis (AarF/ABC1/UbiB family)
LQSIFFDKAQQGEQKKLFNARAARQVRETLQSLKGPLMKLGQTLSMHDFKLLRSISLPAKFSRYSSKEFIAELEEGILKETDYINEGRNIDFFREILKPLRYARVPGVYWPLTTDRVLTMSYVEGKPIADFLSEQRPNQRARNQIGSRLLALFTEMLFARDEGDLVDFGDPAILKKLMHLWGESMRHAAATPEFAFYGRAEMGLYNLLHQFGAKVDTARVMANLSEPT